MTADPAILFVKPKAIAAADKKRLQDAGIIVVEVADPTSVNFVRPHAELPTSDVLTIACDVLSNLAGNSAREAFAKRICDAIVERGRT